jgi:hypothetical protein
MGKQNNLIRGQILGKVLERARQEIGDRLKRRDREQVWEHVENHTIVQVYDRVMVNIRNHVRMRIPDEIT